MPKDPDKWNGRSKNVQQSIGLFDYEHLDKQLQPVSKILCDAAEEVLALVPDNAQCEYALFFLLIAKDAFVRASLGAVVPPGITPPSTP